MVITADTENPINPTKYGSAMSSMPIFDKTCAKERMTAAPTGKAKAQRGQADFSRKFPVARSIIADIIPTVPTAICQVNSSPSHHTPNAAPNKGAVELNVVDSVGPRNRVPATAKFAESDGLKTPTRAKIKSAGFRKFSNVSINGAISQ